MKRTIVVVALVSLTIVALFFVNQELLLAEPTVSPTQTMETANQLYESGQFRQAAHTYQQLVDLGFADSALFYNLGNAHFKQGDMGYAILNYRRAEQLVPRDADVAANLALARAQRVDRLEEKTGQPGFLAQMVKFSQEWLTLNELAIAALVLWILFAFLAIAFSSSKEGSTFRESLGYVLVVTSLALVVGIVALGGRLHGENTRPEAVVIANEVHVTSGPGSQYVAEFTLHSGAEVSLVEVRENWVRLALPTGELQGWVPAGAVEAVVLRN